MVPQEVEKWCKRNGWTEPVLRQGKYYAFPLNAATPQPIPIWWNFSAWWFVWEHYQQYKLAYFLVLAYPLLLLCFFLWDWRGVWSIYISQVDNQKFLACHYCPIVPGILVEMKEPSQGLQEVQSITISKPTKLRFIENMPKVVPQEQVKGRILFIFPHE